MQPAKPKRLTFDGVLQLFGYVEAGQVRVTSSSRGHVTAMTIMGHEADPQWVHALDRLIEDGFVLQADDGNQVELTEGGKANLRRNWPTFSPDLLKPAKKAALHEPEETA